MICIVTELRLNNLAIKKVNCYSVLTTCSVKLKPSKELSTLKTKKMKLSTKPGLLMIVSNI